MKKVGIITFHKSLNYGSALQAWALSRFLMKRNHNVRIVDFTPANYSKLYDLFFIPTTIGLLAYDLLHLIWLPFLLKRKKHFANFQRNNLPLSSTKYDYTKGISKFAEEEDIMICGSDQIWNPTAVDFDMSFLLEGIHNVKKISYAPSLGQSDFCNEKNIDKIINCLLDYDYISVREDTGAQKLKKLIGEKKNISVVLDPTLLLDKDMYEEITSKRFYHQPYIFFYSIEFNEAAMKAAIKISHTLNLPVFTLMSSIGSPRYLKYQHTIKLSEGDAGPSGFLDLVKNAEYIVTDSFHGVAFSIIFEKNFISINRKINEKPVNDERIMNLLKQLHLLDRYVFLEEIDKINLCTDIDYSNIRYFKEKMRLESIEFLDKALL